MDLKHLTNYQLVLLVLLVSFVTSIATGITTVYLLQQSPTVSSVINQVIQRTVETVTVPAGDTIKPKNQVVFIKESDLVPVVVENIKKALVTVSSICEVSDEVGCPKDVYGFMTNTKGEFFSLEKIEPEASSVSMYPNTIDYREWSYTQTSKSESGFTYNMITTPTNKTLIISGALAFSKTLPKEGETLILYDPVTGITKKTYVQTIDIEKKKFTVDQSLNVYHGLPLVNLDGAIAGFIGTDSTAGLVSGVELLETSFTKTDLTIN